MYCLGMKLMSDDEVPEVGGSPTAHTAHGECAEHMHNIIR